MFKKVALAAAIILAGTATSQAKAHKYGEQHEIRVYCAPDGGGLFWHWLPNKRKVQGAWYKKTYKNGRFVKLFLISKQDFQELSDECQNYYPKQPHPRPAYGTFSDWWSFVYYDKEAGVMQLGTSGMTNYYSGYSSVMEYYKK